MTDPDPVNLKPDIATRRWTTGVVALLILLGAVLRLWSFPHLYEDRDVDETGYVQSSLALLEGSLPGFKPSPAAGQIWIGWGYAAVKAAIYTVHPTAEERAVSMSFRPYVALNHVIFDCYRELGPIRRFEIAVMAAISLLAIWAAFRLGMHHGGLAGAILVGGLAACLPLFVEQATQSRPYSLAWSLGIFSLYAAARGSSRQRWVLAASLLGLSIATRVEMACLLPFVCSEYFCPEISSRRRWEISGKILMVSILVALAAAPWWLVALIGNLKTIFAVRVLTAADTIPSTRQTILDVALHQGLLICVLLIFSGLLGRRRWIVALAMLFVLQIFRPTGYGLQHQGPAVVLLVVFSAAGVGWVASRWPRAAVWVAFAALVLPLVQTIRQTHAQRKLYVAADPTRWLNEHVPAGTAVYWTPEFKPLPLPTSESADAIWVEFTGPRAFEKKLQWGAGRLNVSKGASGVPRALSDDIMNKDRTNHRGWFILGGRQFLNVPRFDIHILGGSAVFNNQDTPEQLAKRSGVFVITGSGAMPSLGQPIVEWARGDSPNNVYIYCSADVRPRLIDVPAR